MGTEAGSKKRGEREGAETDLIIVKSLFSRNVYLKE